MAYDALLYLSGTADNPLETVNATGNGDWKYVGANRLFEVEIRCGADTTGTSPTLDVVVQCASDSSGTGAATIGTFAQLTADHVSQGGAAPGTGPARIACMTADGKPWVRWGKTLGGSSSPSFPSTSCVVLPPAGGVAIG